MNNKKEKFARIGIATKGLVYCLLGGLTALAAFGMGGSTTDSSGVLEFLSNQPFGMILLAITALGLVGYVFYRFYQVFGSSKPVNDKKDVAKRVGYFFSGLFYGFLAFNAVQIILGSGSSSGSGGGSNETIVATLLGETYGQILVGILGVIFLGKSINQFYRAYSGQYKNKTRQASDVLLKTGKVGYTARGVVIAIIAYLTFRAAITANSSEAGGTKDAFQFMQNEFGTVMLIVIALGLVAYGIFMFVKAKYERLAF